MEERISNWIATVACGSFIITVILMAFIWFGFTLINSGFEAVYNLMTVKIIVVGVLYMLSLYLVSSLPGRSAGCRLFSWFFSVVFHTGLLLYVGLVLDLGSGVIVIGIAEIIILMLSAWGLFLCVSKSKL